MSWLLNNGRDKQDSVFRIVGKGHVQNNSSTPKTQCYRARKATLELVMGLFQRVSFRSLVPPPPHPQPRAQSPPHHPRLFPAPGKLAALLSSILFSLVNAAGAAAKIEQILSVNGSDGNFQ